MLDPIKTAQSRLDFLRQLHDREALLPREQQRRFLASEGWIAWSGPAIAELLKQFIAHNRMMTGGFSIHGDLVTLSDIDCPVLAVVGEVDDIGQPASVRGIKRAAPQGRCLRIPHPRRAFRPRRRLQGGDARLGRRSRSGSSGSTVPASMPEGVTPMALQPAEHTESGVSLSSRVAHGTTAATEMAFSLARSAADAIVAANKSARTLAVETCPHPAPAGAARPDQRPHPDLARPHHVRAGPRRARTASACCSTAASTPTRRWTAASTTSCAA